MSNIDYSAQALNVLSSFHRKKLIIYVEGKDDIPFWNEIFKLANSKSCHFKDAGGKPELKKYIKAIENEGVEIIVARDCDYSDLLGKQSSHKQVIYTYGYSIENTMYFPPNIAKTIAVLSRTTSKQTKEIEKWLDNLLKDFEELIVYDFANYKYQKGVKVMGDKCVRFLTRSALPSASTSFIQLHLKKIRPLFSDYEITEARKIIKSSKKTLFFTIRGHFLTNAILNYIREKSQSKSLPLDMIYSIMIIQLSTSHQKRLDLEYLFKQIDLI